MIDDDAPADAVAFLNGNPAFALNLWMGAAVLILGAAEGVEGSSMVTRAGGNGVEFGIQIADQPGAWITTPAAAPSGTVEPAHEGRRAVGAIGDSAVVDTLGLGGQSLATADAVKQALLGHLPTDALERPKSLLPLRIQEAGGLRTGLTAATVVTSGITPLVVLGMISDSGDGRIGGGIYSPPITLFEAAVGTMFS